MLPARYPSGGRPVAAVTLYNPLTVAGAVTALAPIGSSAPCSLLIPWNSSVGEPSPLRYANFNLSVNALQRPWLGSASGSHRRSCVIHRRHRTVVYKAVQCQLAETGAREDRKSTRLNS